MRRKFPVNKFIPLFVSIRLPGFTLRDEKLKFTDLGDAISKLLPYLFIFGGIILLGMLVYGGFEMMTSLGNEEKFKGGAERIKNALIGFLMLFGVYWLAQLAQVLFKIPII